MYQRLDTQYLKRYYQWCLKLSLVAIIAVLSCLSIITVKTAKAQTPTPTPSTSFANDAAWSPDSSQLAVSGNFGVALYTVGFQFLHTLTVHPTGRLAWSPNGKYIALGGVNEIRVIDVQTRQIDFRVSLPLKSSIKSIGWNADNQRLAIGVRASAVFIWNPFNGSNLLRLNVPSYLLADAAWSPDGSRIAAVGGDGSQSVDSDALLSIWNANTYSNEVLFTTIPGIPEIYSVVWSPDSSQIALGVGSSSDLNSVPIFDLASRQFRKGYIGAVDQVPALAWSHNGQKLAGSESFIGQGVYVWDTNTKKRLFYLLDYSTVNTGPGPDQVVAITWRPDDAQIITIHYTEPNFRIYDAATGKQLSGPILPTVDTSIATPTNVVTLTSWRQAARTRVRPSARRRIRRQQV